MIRPMYEDPQDPQRKMAVVVQAGGGDKVYLPAMMRK